MSVNLRTVYAFAREMYPKRVAKDIQYGTAGFRAKAEDLDYVMYRMGLLATLRSRSKNGLVIGVMVTASHNPEPDNGVKLIDPMGEMLESHWEKIATDLVNVGDNELEAHVTKIIADNDINIQLSSNVFIGMDNRYHSIRLLEAVHRGVIALKGKVRDFGLATTPMMHYYVVCANTRGAYGQPTEEAYYKKLITAFETLRGEKLENGNYKNQLLFDGANGVGARKMIHFINRMNKSLKVDVFNSGEGKINQDCGADYVKVQQCVPCGMPIAEPNTRCVSVDGDADRLVYFFTDENGVFHLLDGDRIGTLVAGYLMDLVKECGIELNVGLVQTAYANGASTNYIVNELQVPVSCVATGVKHLHHKAIEYDIGVYFEANGHGTIVFSQNAKQLIKEIAENGENNQQKASAIKLLTTIDLINETVGDAISDMLLVETILHAKGWNLKQWLDTYSDLPNLQLKVKVNDRTVITTTDAERICVTPEGLQEEIDKVVANYKKGRSFVRPSGTEDVVRVYAEAATKEEADTLAYEISALVHKLAGGVGPEPVAPEIKLNSHM